jgi:regulator of replication initiation timing
MPQPQPQPQPQFFDSSGHAIQDPSALSTQQVFREVGLLKELVFTRLESVEHGIAVAHEDVVRVPTEVQKQLGGLRELHETRLNSFGDQLRLIKEILETRLAGMDKAIQLLQVTASALPERIDEKIESLAKIHEEKFHSIETQFTERDVRTESSARDSKVAVDAALQAAKEAVAEQNRSSALAISKSEASTIKTIDQMGLLIQTGNKSVDEKIDDVKQRLVRIEGKGEGSQETKATGRESSNMSINIIGLIVAFVIGAAGIIIAIVLRK